MVVAPPLLIHATLSHVLREPSVLKEVVWPIAKQVRLFVTTHAQTSRLPAETAVPAVPSVKLARSAKMALVSWTVRMARPSVATNASIHRVIQRIVEDAVQPVERLPVKSVLLESANSNVLLERPNAPELASIFNPMPNSANLVAMLARTKKFVPKVSVSPIARVEQHLVQVLVWIPKPTVRIVVRVEKLVPPVKFAPKETVKSHANKT